MLIVLEGPDGAGKSTIAKHLLHMLNPSILLSSGPPGQDPKSEYLGKLETASRSMVNGVSVVIDRLHIGELIYGPLLRGGSRLTVHEAYEIDSELWAMNAVAVHVTASTEEIHRRLIERDAGVPDARSGVRLEQSALVRLSYIHHLGRVTGGPRVVICPWIVIDTTGQDPEKIAKDIIKIGMDRRTRPGLD